MLRACQRSHAVSPTCHYTGTVYVSSNYRATYSDTGLPAFVLTTNVDEMYEFEGLVLEVCIAPDGSISQVHISADERRKNPLRSARGEPSTIGRPMTIPTTKFHTNAARKLSDSGGVRTRDVRRQMIKRRMLYI